ncbi:MAG: type VI secretion system baseplate subunit TssK [Zoogloeaceae bacterium]|jgi:type VI secretion system protein ImpJ|nr:type VI secretion system baseplate subunit TssK [Zoogloeaceae bacterium]
MSHKNKVVWSEGMFLRPQHFQQQERYFESRIQRGLTAFTGFFWGFGELEIDQDALSRGTVAVRRAKGILPDGTFFDLAGDSALPLAFDFPPDAKDAKVCLALPPLREGGESVIHDEDAVSSARFRAAAFEAADDAGLGPGAAEIQICVPRFRLALEADVPHGWIAMGMVKIVERQVNNALRPDLEYIPPTLHCGSQKSLSGFIGEVVALLGQRGNALSGRLSASGRGGVSEVGDFLILTLINRWYPLMVHLGQIDALHPERLYAHLLCLAGELSSFSAADRRAPNYPPYVHDDLRASFRPLLDSLRQALAVVLDRSVIPIELKEHKYGIRLARVPDRTLFKQASFVLAVHANLPAEQLQTQFPAQIKIGPVEKIHDLVNLQLPGAGLRLLPVAPRELPYHAGYSYFEIDAQHELWKEMEKSAGAALHVAGDFPGLSLECWAIRK